MLNKQYFAADGAVSGQTGEQAEGQLHDANCDCGCGHDHGDLTDEEGEALITMVDQDSGEEFQFILADEFDFEDEVYCLLLTVDEEDPSAIFVRVETMEDGSEGFVSLEDDEFDRVAEEYDRLCEAEVLAAEDTEEQD